MCLLISWRLAACAPGHPWWRGHAHTCTHLSAFDSARFKMSPTKFTKPTRPSTTGLGWLLLYSRRAPALLHHQARARCTTICIAALRAVTTWRASPAASCPATTSRSYCPNATRRTPRLKGPPLACALRCYSPLCSTQQAPKSNGALTRPSLGEQAWRGGFGEGAAVGPQKGQGNGATHERPSCTPLVSGSGDAASTEGPDPTAAGAHLSPPQRRCAPRSPSCMHSAYPPKAGIHT